MSFTKKSYSLPEEPSFTGNPEQDITALRNHIREIKRAMLDIISDFNRPGVVQLNLAAAVTGILPVTNGGTGRVTSTTAYGLLAAGTTATGAHQTIAAGATTEILVGGGASALPVWTTASGSGAPLRQTSPSLTTPTINTAASVGGTWTAAATWTLPAYTLGGTVTVNGQTFSGAAVFSTTVTGGSFIPSGSSAPSNGMYLPAANTLGWSCNSVERARLDGNGKLSLTSTINNGYSVTDGTATGVLVPSGLGTNSIALFVTSNHGLFFGTNNTSRVSINASGKMTTQATASGTAGFNVPHGTAPSSPADGDMWTTTAGLFVRVNGVTKTVTLT